MSEMREATQAASQMAYDILGEGVLDGVATGKYASISEAMDAIGAKTVDLDEIDLDDKKGTLQ